MTDQEIRDRLSLYKFYHIIPLTETISTPGNPLYLPAQHLYLKYMRTLDFQGKRVLDIGCRDGLFSFEAEKRGAAEVIGIDNDLSKPAVEFLIPFFQSRIKMVQMNLYDLQPETFGLFDVILFPGVLYHLRYPFWALRIVRELLNKDGILLIETAIWNRERDNSLLFCPTGKESPYEPSSCTFFNIKALTDTLHVMGFDVFGHDCLPAKKGWSAWRKESAGRLYFLLNGRQRPIRDVTRCVMAARFNGIDKESRYLQYWESTHSIHSKIGG